MEKVIISAVVTLGLLFFPTRSLLTQDKAEPKEFERQWSEVVNKYPMVARAYLHQQINHTNLLTAIFSASREYDASGYGSLAHASRHDLCCDGVKVGSQLIMIDPRFCEGVLCGPKPIETKSCIDACFASDKYDQPGQDRMSCLRDCLKPSKPMK